MRYLLDTNICIQLIRQKPAALLARLTASPIGEVGLSTITVAQLHVGVRKSRDPTRNAEALVLLLLPLEIVGFDSAAAEAYGHVRAALESAGTPIGPLDTLIASHAVSLKAILITDNMAEFGRVPGLRIENWLR
jgi:tRNA(fMet)-specific endonuclease VapC